MLGGMTADDRQGSSVLGFCSLLFVWPGLLDQEGTDSAEFINGFFAVASEVD